MKTLQLIALFVPALVERQHDRLTAHGGEPAKMLNTFQASGNPILVRQAGLQRTFPPKAAFPR